MLHFLCCLQRIILLLVHLPVRRYRARVAVFEAHAVPLAFLVYLPAQTWQQGAYLFTVILLEDDSLLASNLLGSALLRDLHQRSMAAHGLGHAIIVEHVLVLVSVQALPPKFLRSSHIGVVIDVVILPRRLLVTTRAPDVVVLEASRHVRSHLQRRLVRVLGGTKLLPLVSVRLVPRVQPPV